MAYDEGLAERIRKTVSRKRGVSEKEMFGGIAFLLDGKMFVGIVKDDLMVRLDPEQWEAAIAEPHARAMDFTGKPMRGYVYVAPAGLKREAALASWIGRAADYVATLPAKKKAKKPSPRPRAPRRAR